MDIISHGLWGGAVFGRKAKKAFWFAFFFGVVPDLFSFGIFTAATTLGVGDRPDWSAGPPDPSVIPAYVHQLYDATHSLVVIAVVFGIVWLILRKPYWALGGWGLHIVMDIFTHSRAFFPTPFLWPLSDITFNGIPWSRPIIFIPNVLALLVVYATIVWRRRAKRGVHD